MAWYRTGTVAVTNGSKTVTGASTAWVSNVQPGDEFEGPDGKRYEVDQVISNTGILLVESYAGTTVASGGTYKAIPTQGRVRDMAAAVLQLISDYGAVESALTVSSGKIGLGVAPATKLHVLSSEAEKVRFQGTAGVGNNYLSFYNSTLRQGYVGFGAVSDDTLYITAETASPIAFCTSSTERVRIDASGNLVQRLQGSVPALSIPREAVLTYVNDTTVRLSLRGGDGVTRATNWTLA